MPRFLIKASQPTRIADDRIVESVRTIGSHFATHATWRRAGEMATGTLVVEVDNHRRALAVVPPNMRSSASVHELSSLANDTDAFRGYQAPYPIAA